MSPEEAGRERRVDGRPRGRRSWAHLPRGAYRPAVTGEGLAHAFLEATAVIDIEAGVNLDPDVAEKALEWLVGEIQAMSPEEREVLQRVAARKAAAETVPERKRFFADFAEAYRLFDEIPPDEVE